MIHIELATVCHLHSSTLPLSITAAKLPVYSPSDLPLPYCRVIPLHPPWPIGTTLAIPRRGGGDTGTGLTLVPVPPSSPPVRGGGVAAFIVPTVVPTGRADYSSIIAGTNMPGHRVQDVVPTTGWLEYHSWGGGCGS